MSLVCYNVSTPLGAKDPNGLPCAEDAPAWQPPDFIQAGLYTDGQDENIWTTEGMGLRARMDIRETPFGENRKTAHFGGRGETNAPRQSMPFAPKLTNAGSLIEGSNVMPFN